MKVKISYTTEYNDVPEECFRIIDSKIHDGFKFRDCLKDIVSELLDQTDSFDVVCTLQKIHKLRIILSEYDETMQDIQTILNGWSEIQLRAQKNDATLQSEQQEQVDPQRLAESLKALKQMTEVAKNSLEQQ